MKILLLEFSPTKVGHKRLFQNTCDILASQSDLYAMAPDDWELSSNCKVVRRIKEVELKSKNNFYTKIAYLFHSLQIMRAAAKWDKQERFDAVVCITYSVEALYIGQVFFNRKDKIFLMQHNNIDRAEKNKLTKWEFTKIASKVRHIVQCQYVGDYICSAYAVPESHIVQWLHPLNKNVINSYIQDEVYDCVGISNSNDEIIINSIIQHEKSTYYLRKKKIRVLLRSRKNSYDDGYLKVITGILPKSQYDSYISGAKCIFLPFPQSFVYRMSGTIVDAFSNDKPIIGTNIMLVKKCSETYPDICKIFSVNDFDNQIIALGIESAAMKESFARFKMIHSYEYLRNVMVKQLEASLKDEKYTIETDF